MARHEYTPVGAAIDLFNCRDDEVLMSGPAGTGKSRACLEKLFVLALKNPGLRGLIIRKTRVSLASTALATWAEFVIPEAVAAGLVRYRTGSGDKPAKYEFANGPNSNSPFEGGSQILIGGLDIATRIMSSEYDVIFVQEAIELTLNDWESLTTRLRHGTMSFHQLMADTNPSSAQHWLYQRVQAGKCTMLESRHEDNPRLFDPISGEMTIYGKSYMTKLDRLTGVRYYRLRRGMWVSAEGIIYENFDENVHILPADFEIPEDWPRYWSVDFGYTNPFVCQWWAVDPDGRLYLYREIYKTQRLVEDHARVMLAAVTHHKTGEWKEPEPVAIICDHDAEDRATLERHLGRSTVPANKTVSEGIQAVQSRMKVQPDGKPRIFFLRNTLVSLDHDLKDAVLPTCTVEEISGYVWEPSHPDKPNKEHPHKKDDHGMDTTRYVVAEHDLSGAPRMRWL